MNTILRQHESADLTLRPLIAASAATVASRPSLLDRVALRVALRLLLWSTRSRTVSSLTRDEATARHTHRVAREHREREWQRRRDLTIPR